MLKKNSKNLISFLTAFSAIAFYFVGFFTVKDPANGGVVIDSIKLWSVGLRVDASGVAEYIDFMTVGIMTTIVIALLISIFFTVIFFILFFASLKTESLKTEVAVSVFSMLVFVNFASAFIMCALFYSSSHPSFLKHGTGGIGFGAVLALLLHLISVCFQIEKAASELYPYFKAKREGQLALDPVEPELQTQPYLPQEPLYPPQPAYPPEHRQPTPAQGIPPAAAVHGHPAQFYGQLVFVSGQYEGSKINMKKDRSIVLGKDSAQCAVVFDQSYKSISRKHCAVKLTDRGFMIADYSKNGIFDSYGNRIECNGFYIPIGDHQTVRLAKTDNQFILKRRLKK